LTIFFRWVLAIGFSGLFVVLVHLFALGFKPEKVEPTPLPELIGQPETLFIGTSLFAHGIPRRGQGLMEGQSSYERIAAPAMSETVALDVLESALDIQSIQCVVIEISLFIRSFNFEVNPKSLGLLQLLRNASRQFKGDIRLVLGFSKPEGAGFYFEPEIDKKASRDPVQLERFYPFVIREPEQKLRLSALLARAAEQSVQVIFILPPRSESAANYMGRRQTESLAQQANALASTNGVPLWNAGSAWPDELFVDYSHLNLAGRGRFMAFLTNHANSLNDR
jgi:hypothetical protein